MIDPLNLAGVKLGNYRLQRLLGRGNMGAVYLATDEALLRPTAVKVLTWSPAEHDPEAWFLAEARSVARLNHPSVIQIYSVARHGPYCYIAMEYVEGASAEAIVARDGALSAERATEVILQVAAALELAHANGIIHRDVKPGNILIDSDGRAKLGDFGMAVSALRASLSARAGTPHYFAPEIWRGEPASIATDLYALGATYYYLLTGRPPLDGSTIAGLSAAHQHQEVIAPPELPAACMRIVRRCLAKSPGERYQSAGAAAWATRGALRELASPWLAPRGEPAARRADTAQPALGEASPPWLQRGFQLEPFADIDASAPPYPHAPFDRLRNDLVIQLTTPGTAVVLAGAPGSGRSAVARAVLGQLADGPAGGAPRGVYVDLGHASARPGSVVQRVARGFGAIASPTAGGNAEIEGLLELLARTSPAAVPVVVVDGVAAGTRAAADVAVLARAARSTRYFSLLVVGAAELSIEGGDAPVAVPALTPPQVGGYVDGWLRATRASNAPPLIVTVDAALVVGHRTDGNLARINALVRRMIAGGGPILTSWDAWTAADDVAWQPAARPAVWPTADALRLINHCRAAAGLGKRT